MLGSLELSTRIHDSTLGREPAHMSYGEVTDCLDGLADRWSPMLIGRQP